ncbi:ATP-binding protein [Wenzhouxiangella sp. EGI_FJ10305]|uniref:ATP-binding protein n=1 Tax=Wenzhouxiangella sp. EGI_FJ10305 TaxID=3243768 RepID=UPI0035D628A3
MSTQYLKRIVDGELDELLPQLPAISLEGPKGVGKTETARRRAETIHQLDDPAQRTIVEADPSRVLSGDPPLLIDEWQRVPAIWDIVRRAVDAGCPPSKFLLTGSASPADAPTHSGAGRIVTVRMRPLSLAERNLTRPTVSLGELLLGERPGLDGKCETGLKEYVDEIVQSGLPGLRDYSGRGLRAQLDGYLHRIIERDFQEQGLTVRRPDALRRWLIAYAAATATSASFEAIRDAATSGEGDKPAKTTTQPWHDALARLWILDPVPAWLPTQNELHRLAQSPKHHLADPALAARLLGLDAAALLEGSERGPRVARGGSLLGRLFESLVTLSLRVYAQASEAHVRHLRLHGGQREIDLIIERADRKVLAIEVKLSRTVSDEDVKHLLWLKDRIGDDLLDAVVIHTGPEAYRRKDGIGVIPAALLTA